MRPARVCLLVVAALAVLDHLPLGWRDSGRGTVRHAVAVKHWVSLTLLWWQVSGRSVVISFAQTSPLDDEREFA
ncbi:MAG: hypothetical protein OXE94_01070 [Aestuariivita sp.]|nr:hypothetical protein [Aestuariivita sp.]MCY4203534.1 hypothetical protein [Aestuariivita sp.]